MFDGKIKKKRYSEPLISDDGARSKKRKWFAEKLIAKIRDIDVPAKSVVYEGFTFSVKQQDDFASGRITAPMGAVVAMSYQDDLKHPVKLAVADFWAGAFTSYVPAHTLYYDAPGNTPVIKVINLASAEDVAADGNQTIEYISYGSESCFGLVDGDPNNCGDPGTVLVRDYSPLPGLMPYKGAENFNFSITDNAFIDFNESGYADFPKYIYENTTFFYSSDGSNLGGRRTCALQVGEADEMAGVPQPLRPVQQITSDHQYIWQNEWYESDGELIAGRNFQHPNTWPVYLKDLIPEDTVPDELRALLINADLLTVRPQGSYSFSLDGVQTILHVVDVTNWLGTPGYPTDDYFDDHPEHEQWRIFYVMQVGTSMYVIDSDQFMGLLSSLATIDVYASWTNAHRMMDQLLPSPNNKMTVPYDASIWHGHDGNVYTWTREYDAVKFTPSGLFSASVTVPDEVTNTEGVKPEISYAGTYDEEPIYFCSCNRVKEEIEATYIGSPFTEWFKLPHTPEEYILVHVRPVRVTPTDVFLIGVVKRILDPVYSFASLRWVTDSEELWRVMGQLPFPVGDNDNFQTCLYGNGKLVQELLSYPSPPPTLPQMPVGPYDKYSIGMP